MVRKTVRIDWAYPLRPAMSAAEPKTRARTPRVATRRTTQRDCPVSSPSSWRRC